MFARGAVAAVVLAAVLAPLPATAQPGTTYYIDNRAGSNCANGGAGTSPSAPWCDFGPVEPKIFDPGDRVLLARGATWNQMIYLRGTGTAAAPIVLDAYGSGPRPHIRRDGKPLDRAVLMLNPTHWRVSNVDISNAGTGLMVFYNTLGNEGLTLTDISVRDIRGIHHTDTAWPGPAQPIDCGRTNHVYNSAGIEITGDFAHKFGTDKYAVKGVLLRDIEATSSLAGVSFDWCNGLAAQHVLGGDGSTLVREVVMDGLNLHDNGGPARGCDDTLRLVNLRDALIMNSVVRAGAACRSETGTAGVFVGRVADLQVVNSIFADTPRTGSVDETGFDYETATERVHLRNNLISGNSGPGVSVLAHHGTDDRSLDHQITGNLFLDNGRGNDPVHKGGIARLVSNHKPTGVIAANLHAEPTGFLHAASGGTFDGFRISGNRQLNAVAEASYAAAAFGTPGSPWGYQRSADGQRWQDLRYDAAAKEFRADAGPRPVIRKFTQTAEEGAAWSARTWTAPKDGSVHLRGRVLKTELGGDGVAVRITRNGQVIGGPLDVGPRERNGVDVNLDDVPVRRGDVLRFELSSKGDATNDSVSWVPAVGYAPGPEVRWDFTNGRDGWDEAVQLTGGAAGGELRLEATGGDPAVYSPDGLGVDTRALRFVEVRMRNETTGTGMQVYFTTDADQKWADDKQIGATAVARDAYYTTYRVDVGAHPKWTGTLKRFRVDPTDAPGPVKIDSIRLVG